MSEIKHDLVHGVYIESDGKEHINHGKTEYTKADLESAHAYYDEYHKGEEIDPSDAKINDYHIRHQDKKLDQFCDIHPDAEECRVYDE